MWSFHLSYSLFSVIKTNINIQHAKGRRRRVEWHEKYFNKNNVSILGMSLITYNTEGTNREVLLWVKPGVDEALINECIQIRRWWSIVGASLMWRLNVVALESCFMIELSPKLQKYINRTETETVLIIRSEDAREFTEHAINSSRWHDDARNWINTR
jgi:hypothetical protein